MTLWQILGRRQPIARTPQRRRFVLNPVERLEDRLTPNSTYHPLASGAFMQDWSSPSFPADDDWSAVPSIIGYRGDGLAPTAGTNPATIVAPGTGTDFIVDAGVSELPIFHPSNGITQFVGSYQSIALAGTDAVQAPNLVLHLDTRGTRNVRLSMELIDAVLWPSLTVQPLAVQYRVGTTGNFTNIPYAFVADASASQYWGEILTPLTATLPAETWDQAQVQIRIIVTNAVDAKAPVFETQPVNDHWILVDNIRVTGANTPASVMPFSIVTTSALTMSGSVAGGAITGQGGAAALTTTYSGNINVLWDRVAGRISFIQQGTAATAASTGRYRPGIGGPDCSGAGCPFANYGAQATILGFITARVAIRDLVGALATTTPLVVSGTGPWTFPSTQTMIITNGFADFNAGLAGEGRENISGESGPNMAVASSSLADISGTLRLTVPIFFRFEDTIEGEPVIVNLNGTFTANQVASPITLDLNGASTGLDNLAGFVSGSAASVIPNMTVTRTPAANLTQAIVTLTNRPDGGAEALAVSLGGSGLTLTAYNPATGQLILSGSASLATYQTVLRTLTYNNTATNPNTATRLIEVQVFDGTFYSQTRTAGVTVAKPNNAPSISLSLPEFISTPVDTDFVFSSDLGSAITISDPDAGSLIQVSMSTWTGGTFTLGSTAGITFVSGADSSFFMTIRGTAAAVTAALEGLRFTPRDPEFTGDDFLLFVVSDVLEREATGTVSSATVFTVRFITVG